MSLSEKAKTLAQLNPEGKEEYCRGCYKKETECPKCFWNAEQWVLVSVAQQEIDQTEADCKEKSEGYAKVCARLHEHIIDLERERGELKQKLQQEYGRCEKIEKETGSALWREGARWNMRLIEELLKQ